MNVLTAKHLAAEEITPMSNIAIDAEKTPAAAVRASEPETESKNAAKRKKPVAKEGQAAKESRCHRAHEAREGRDAGQDPGTDIVAGAYSPRLRFHPGEEGRAQNRVVEER